MRNRKSFILASLLLITYAVLHSQVGIGTVTPHASSILEVVSETSGMLTPRMNTSQRLAISSPADGLLVYDTDEGAFYYYENSMWNKLEGAQTRDKHKLIKSATDLADELAAGGGTTYLLTTDTYYEINGTITLAAPIDLNNAYISGLDTNEDVLERAGGAIFSGSKGGSIRGLTLIATGGGGKVFDLSGSLAEVLVFQNCIIKDSESVGSISVFGVVFMSIVQLANNTNGIVYTNIGNVLLSNVAWFDSNGGTYEKYIGGFGLIEKTSGFCKVGAGAIGLDVSSNPVVAQGSLLNTPFSGLGTFVMPYTGVGTYTGFSFNNNWIVNTPGLPLEADSNATGYYYMTGNTLETVFAAANVPVKVAGVTTSSDLFRVSSTSNRLVYEGKETREFQIFCTGTVDNDATSPNARIYEFVLSKTPNGGSAATVPAISSERRFSNNDIGNFTLTGLISLSPGDAIEVFASVNRVDGTLNAVVTRLSMVLK